MKTLIAIVTLGTILSGCASTDRIYNEYLCERSRVAHRIERLTHKADRLARAAILREDFESAEEFMDSWLAVSAATNRTYRVVVKASADLGAYKNTIDAKIAEYLIDSVGAAYSAANEASVAVRDVLSEDSDSILRERAETAAQRAVSATATALKAARSTAGQFSHPGCN